MALLLLYHSCDCRMAEYPLHRSVSDIITMHFIPSLIFFSKKEL